MSAAVPWYLLGPALGLVVAGLYALANQPLGGSSAYIQFSDLLLGRPVKEWWRTWFLWGVLAGALLAGVLGGNVPNLHYGALGRVLPLPLLLVVLLCGGVIMGYGARWAGGCTSGHGFCGVASRSAGSIVATMSFMGTAVVVTLGVHLLTRGVL